ncbi:hypothetical protein [Paenarthrobacter sp. AMU7]|uniref:Uncharacterized protein n=1 Tax=Paenarthrobacter sp. AMU7 TaxID=3162492 RepID=A0AB39YUG3_9MICC
MTPPIAYFQAAATAIPALMIAVAVGMRRGHKLAELSGTNATRRIMNLNVVLLLFFLIGAGEVNALLAIATNGGTAVQGYWAYQGIILAFAQLGHELVTPVLSGIEDKKLLWVGRIYTMILPLVALAYGQAVFFGPDYNLMIITQRCIDELRERFGWLASTAEVIKLNPVYSL